MFKGIINKKVQKKNKLYFFMQRKIEQSLGIYILKG
jgi:hypothetical protein